jgi:hypothetical protein
VGLGEVEPGGGSPAVPCPLQTLGPSCKGPVGCQVLAVAAGHLLQPEARVAPSTPAEQWLEKEGQPGGPLGAEVQPWGPPAAQRGLQEKEMSPQASRHEGLQWDAPRHGYEQAGQRQWAAEGPQGRKCLHREHARREACVCWPLRHPLIVSWQRERPSPGLSGLGGRGWEVEVSERPFESGPPHGPAPVS